MQKRLMDLQLFAEEEVSEEVTETEITEEEVQEEEIQEEATQEEAEKETQEESHEEVPEKKTAEKKDSVPLAKYLAEKKKRQEAERILLQQAAEREKGKLVQELIERGWPEAEAEHMAADKVRQKQEADEVKDKLLDIEIRDLARSDSFFADATSFIDDIKAKMRDAKASAEEAYMMLRGRARTREVQLEQEQRNLIKRGKVEAKKIPNAAPAASKSPYPMDADDKKALAGLQKAFPDGGWTALKYWELMKKDAE